MKKQSLILKLEEKIKLSDFTILNGSVLREIKGGNAISGCTKCKPNSASGCNDKS